eukprot:gene7151-258_t
MGSLQPADERTSTSAAASTSRSGQSDAGSANIDGNFYECLGLRTQASEREIKQAYRVHARLWHPDTNTQEGAEVAFQKIKMAHEVLTDEELREDYDLNLNMGAALRNVLMIMICYDVLNQVAHTHLMAVAFKGLSQ